PPSERDRVVYRPTAGIQHDRFALELTIAREIIEIPWGLGGDDADCADPASAIRLASDPGEFHRQFALFDAGMRRTAQRGHQPDQCDVSGGGAERYPRSLVSPVSAHDVTSALYRGGLAVFRRVRSPTTASCAVLPEHGPRRCRCLALPETLPTF